MSHPAASAVQPAADPHPSHSFHTQDIYGNQSRTRLQSPSKKEMRHWQEGTTGKHWVTFYFSAVGCVHQRQRGQKQVCMCNGSAAISKGK